MNEEFEPNPNGAGSFGIAARGQDRQLDIMRKMGVNILQKALFPSNKHLKQSMLMLDLAIKAEFILLELTSTMFWCSYIEATTFAAVLFIFIQDPSELGAIWWFSPHLIRGAIGFFIVQNIPMTHDIIKNAEFSPNQKMKIDDVFNQLTKSSQDALDHFTTLAKKLLQAYFMITILCLPIDLVSFLAAVKNFSGGKSPYADCTLLISSIILLAIDVFYISWVNSLQNRVPPYVSAGVTKAMFGSMDYLYRAVGEKLEKEKLKREEKLQNERNAFEQV